MRTPLQCPPTSKKEGVQWIHLSGLTLQNYEKSIQVQTNGFINAIIAKRRSLTERPTVHIGDECTQVDQEFRVQALQRLSRGNSIDDSSILDIKNTAKGNKTLKRKKTEENEKLTGFMERPLDPQTSHDISLRLLRCVLLHILKMILSYKLLLV